MKDVEECSATRLLNGVMHLWSDNLIPTASGGQSAADDILEIAAQEEAMDSIVVNESSVDMGDE